eukprot:TRINITY_DN6325_c0_g2_i1.p1 TRINITY_DN6325_c0_g2~~TRINITY_DN6325_c0_g2_i1.p1  ORF type:complete len:122 (+),score=25.99 TRINITY_DN6325_c0_g2_i1:62-427(+)
MARMVLAPVIAFFCVASVWAQDASSNSQFLAMSSEATAASVTEGVQVKKAAKAPVVLEEADKLHPPTTKQAIAAFILILAVPALGVAVMIKMKGYDWCGACQLIGGLIALVWIYSAVTYYQ